MLSFGSASLSTFLMEVANFFVQVSEFTWMNVYHLEGTFSQHLHSFSGGSLAMDRNDDYVSLSLAQFRCKQFKLSVRPHK